MLGAGGKIALFLTLIFSPSFASAEGILITPVQIISGDEIALRDGRVVRLDSIKAASPDAKSFLEATVLGHPLSLQDAVDDRYGRIVATVTVQGQKQSVQEAMLCAGVAFVYPATGDADQLEAMLAQEHAARAEKRGIWAMQNDTQATNAATLQGKYGFVTGVVASAVRVKTRLYLNFGANTPPAFIIAIAPHNLRAFKKQGLDPLSWQGQRLRVRGWVTKDSAPTITVSDPHQIELIP